jgi:hypothetical protein
VLCIKHRVPLLPTLQWTIQTLILGFPSLRLLRRMSRRSSRTSNGSSGNDRSAANKSTNNNDVSAPLVSSSTLQSSYTNGTNEENKKTH